MTCAARPRCWFGRVVWLGILANLALAIPTLLVPERLMAMANLPPAIAADVAAVCRAGC